MLDNGVLADDQGKTGIFNTNIHGEPSYRKDDFIIPWRFAKSKRLGLAKC
jgi:hypothetical protein